MKLPRSTMVLEALLTRADAVDADRMVALGELAKARKSDPVSVLLSEMDDAGNSSPGDSARRSGRRRQGGRVNNTPPAPAVVGIGQATVARLLPYQSAEKLKPFRAELVELTEGTPAVRPCAWAALALADGSFDTVWREASPSPDRLADLLNGIPMLPDAEVRAQAYGRIKPLLDRPIDPPTLGWEVPRTTVAGATNSPAPYPSLSFLRRAVINALVSMNHEPEAVFSALANLISHGEEVPAAAHGLRVIPRPKWPRAQAGQAATALVAWAKTVPASDRTSSDY
jgi:hypothetical protein